MANYSFSQLEDLWKQAGGNPAAAAIAAAVALAESSGNPNNASGNGNGSVDRGLWQINSVHGSQSTFDPMGNARAAVAISNNGSNWKPWCTAWTDGLCGTRGGHFDPTGASPSGRRLSSNGGGSVPPNSGSGGGDSSGGGVVQTVGPLDAEFWDNIIDHFVAGIMNLANHLLFISGVVLGGVSFAIGFIMLFRETSLGESVGSAVQTAGRGYRNVGAAALRRIKK